MHLTSSDYIFLEFHTSHLEHCQSPGIQFCNAVFWLPRVSLGHEIQSEFDDKVSVDSSSTSLIRKKYEQV